MLLQAEDVQEVFPDVDDTDGLDEQAEFDEWKLRELMRIKRDKEAQYAYALFLTSFSIATTGGGLICSIIDVQARERERGGRGAACVTGGIKNERRH